MKILNSVALSIPRLKRLRDERDSLASRLLECERRTAPSPFLHYNALFDPLEVIRRHALADVKATRGYVTNFLGVRIDPVIFPAILDERAGTVEAIPIPSNWHADIAEWGAALRSVDLAQQTFTVLELGCGWGCWMNNTGVAARRAGLNVHLIGVEADEVHVRFATECCASNGFNPDQVNLLRGIAAPSSGIALFPRQEGSARHWGLKPIFAASSDQRSEAALSGQYEELPMIALREVVESHSRIDLLHLDIQGGEADFICGCLPLLREKVAYIVVGTHSRQIEGSILSALLEEGWTLEIERPAILGLEAGTPDVRVDGVQGWRNPRIAHL